MRRPSARLRPFGLVGETGDGHDGRMAASAPTAHEPDALAPARVWRGGRLVLPDRVADDLVLYTDGDRIEAVCRDADVAGDVPRRDLAGAYLLPGLIDVHTHGALGRSFLEGDDEAFETVLMAQARHG